MSEFEQWVASFTTRKHVNRSKYTIDRIDPEFCIVLDCSKDTDNPELSANTCDILIERNCDSEESVRLVANANKHGVMRFIAAIGVNRFDDKVKDAFYATTQPVLRADAVDDLECETCGVGSYLPSGVCDHCNTKRTVD